MGRVLNISQPTVLNTELAPLSDDLTLITSGSELTEQWYYVNNSIFSPDREIRPLIISPLINAIDLDTDTEYTNCYIANVHWYALEWKGTTTGWVESEIQSSSSSAPYYLSGNTLVVRKNMTDAEHGVTIRCVVSYEDPRDSSVLNQTEEKLILSVNVDATVLYPRINIENETCRIFDPLRDDTSIFNFQATSDWGGVSDNMNILFEYKVDPQGNEIIMPDNSSSLKTSAPIMDISYGGTILTDQQFMSRQVSGGVVSDIPNNVATILRIKGNTTTIDNILVPLKMSSIKTTSTQWENIVSIPITSLKGQLNGSGNSVVVFSDGMKKNVTTYDEITIENGNVKAYKRIGSRAYSSGDESDTSVTTDGTTTYYTLSSVQEYVMDALPRGVFEWYGIQNNNEVLIQNLLAYQRATQPSGGGQGTSTINMNAMYSENITVVLRIKRFASDAEPMPPKEYRSVVWKSHAIEGIVFSENGEMVRNNSKTFTFSTIVNIKGENLSEVKINENLRFKWYTRKGHLSVITNKGFARRLELDKSEVWSTRTQSGQTKMSSCDVGNDIYLLDAYEPLTFNNEEVTYNNDTVFVRPLNDN